MKNIYNFLCVIVYVFATIGATAYLFYDKHIAFAIANLCLAAMAFPYAYARLKEILGK